MSTAIKQLEWDSNFLGFPVAYINSFSQKTEEWNNILSQLKNEGIKLAYWQALPDNVSFHAFAKENNGNLVDIKTTYSVLLDDTNYMPAENIEIFTDTQPDDQLLKLAVQCGAFSRFSIDKKIPREKFEELYQLWIINSVNKSMADDVLVYKSNEKVVGLVTVYKKEKIGNIGLIGVDEDYRGKGIGRALMNGVKNYFLVKGIQRINVVTQGQNQPASKLYENTGFIVLEKYEFYHFWLR